MEGGSDMFKLTAENYSYWKPMMEDHLYCKDLYEPILHQLKPGEKTDVNDAQWAILNRKTVGTIRKFIDKSLFEHVSNFTNAYELWMKLESLIQKKTPRNKAYLIKRLAKMEYKDGQSMIEHLSAFKGLINQLEKAEMKIDDKMQALLLMSSLPESWDTLVISLSNSAPEGRCSMDLITDSLISEETRRKERGTYAQAEANIAENRGRSDNREGGGWRGKDRSKGRSKSRTKLTCYYCGKAGHRKAECRYHKRDLKSGNVKPDRIEPKRKDEAKETTATLTTSDEVFLICGEEHNAHGESPWIVDSGASFHVTPYREAFTS